MSYWSDVEAMRIICKLHHGGDVVNFEFGISQREGFH